MAGESTIEPDWLCIRDVDGESLLVLAGRSLDATAEEGRVVEWCTRSGKG